MTVNGFQPAGVICRRAWLLVGALSIMMTSRLAADSPYWHSQPRSLPAAWPELADSDDDWVHQASAASMALAPGDSAGGPSECTAEQRRALRRAATGAYKGVFYANDFSYLCDPCYDGWHLGENLKRIGIAPWMMVDVGGQYRARLHNERNMRNAPPIGLGLTGASDDFLLHRTRLYVNSQIGQRVRFYGEMLDAVSQFENFAPRAIEENRAELQNLFLDVVALEGARGSLTGRVGRQEVILGSQRLISPLDWANTRRTFQGGRLMWLGENWDLDGFWVRPMRRDVRRLDPPDLDRQLYGVYSNYKGLERDGLELYWLANEDTRLGFHYHTIGSRYHGERDDWLYEAEGGVQFGKDIDDTDHSAGFFTLGLGRRMDMPWQPTLWTYYDWASGDDTVNNGFHHYEPLAHRFLGFMDLFGRRNIETVNLLLTAQPRERLQLLVWYYYFWLQNGNDVPYTVVMTPYAGMTSGTGVRDLGHEIDFLATWSMTPRTELQFGYSRFFAGRFYRSTDLDVPNHADFFYTQFTVNF